MASKNQIGRLSPLRDNVGTITFVPGVRFVYPVLENWWLKPFGQFGFGKVTGGTANQDISVGKACEMLFELGYPRSGYADMKR